MTAFRYKALDAQGMWRDGEVEADSASQAARRLSAEGIIPVAILPAGAAAGQARRRANLFARKADAAAFARSLALLLGAGLTLDEGLAALAQAAGHTDDAGGRLAERLRERVRRGGRFSEALASEGAPLDGLFSQLVAAGEATGRLSGVLETLARHLEAAKAFRTSIVSALIYPAILVAMSLASLFFMLIVVVPSFEAVLEGGGTQGAMGFLIAASKVAEMALVLLPLAGLAVYFALRRMLANPRHRRAISQRLLAAPLVGGFIRKIEAARFCATFGMLLAQGLDLLPSLKLATGAVANPHLREALGEVQRRVRTGERLSSALSGADLLPPLAMQMVSVGETSGRLGPMFQSVGQRLEAEIAEDSKRFLALLEPALVLIMGLMIGAFVLTIFGAISGLSDLVP